MLKELMVIYIVLFVIFVLGIQTKAEILKNWKFNSDEDVSVVADWCPGEKITYNKSFANNERVNGFKGAFILKVINKDAKAGIGSLQLGFIYKKSLQSNVKYKVSFYAKNSVESKIMVIAIMNVKPWAILGRTASLKAEVGPEWKKYEYEFSSRYDYNKAIRVPCIFLGALPSGAVFMIQNVKFEKID